MKRSILLLLSSFCFALSSISLSAQELSGIVLDGLSGEKLPGASIYFKRDRSLGTTTGIDGKFQLKTNGSPSDTIIVSFVGYKTKVTSLALLKQNSVILLSSSRQEIQEIVVKGERLIAEEFNVKKINQIEIYKNPSANADPLLAVNSLPSATTTDESANVSFRGSSANETGIFYNDVPIYDAIRFAGLNGIGTFSIFNTSIVKDVVVFPGNPPLEYGNTTAGVISIYTNDKIPVKSQNSAVISLASIGYNRYQKINDRTGLTFFTNYSPSAAIRSLNGEALRNILEFRSNDIGLHLIHKFDTRTQLSIFNYAISEGYTFRLQEPTFEGGFQQKRKRNFTVLNLKKTWRKSSIAFNGGYSISRQNFDYSQADIDIDNRDYFLGFNYQYYGVHSDLKLGFSLDNRRQEFAGNIPIFDFAIGPEHPFIFVEQENDVAVPEVYLYYKYDFSDKWTAGLGGRKNVFQSDVDSYWSYQSNLQFKPTKHLQFIFGLGQYHRNQLGRNEGSDQLMRSRQASLDIKYKRNRLEQSLSFFYKKNRSTREAEISGIEYFTDFRLDARTRLQLSASAIRARENNGEFTYSTPFDINPFVKGSISREFRYGISMTTNFVWRQGLPFRPIV
ncbi:MAG: TonB-dependent receptor, partial [Bacteroidota bacterium]